MKFAVKKLCRRDATLVKAERTLKLTIETLASLDTEVANEVYDAFVNRVKDRRNSETMHVMEYLSNPDFVKTCKTDSFGAKVDAKKIKDKMSKKRSESLERLYLPGLVLNPCNFG